MMMGRQSEPAQLFYDFCLEDHVPSDHLLRKIDHFLDLSDVRSKLASFYSAIGRPSNVVATAVDAPGIPSMTELIAPPYMAP